MGILIVNSHASTTLTETISARELQWLQPLLPAKSSSRTTTATYLSSARPPPRPRTSPPYFAPSIQVDDKTITVEEFRAIVPPNTEITAERFVADVEARTLAVRVKIHVPAMGLKMTEHVFYELDSEWRINKVVRLYAIEGNEVPIGN
ncbi:hypothetical protein MVEN_00575600 [Mycena venus]|uniref:Uncharacterized protein n=1 Tax=Mycena venus TaxID=2733690 RepID=A0A8H7D5M1_9AGAR|nr:hypothetical protein MVEN_00575600 [Mycena venus]